MVQGGETAHPAVGTKALKIAREAVIQSEEDALGETLFLVIKLHDQS